jgi:hypothetical protein
MSTTQIEIPNPTAHTLRVHSQTKRPANTEIAEPTYRWEDDRPIGNVLPRAYPGAAVQGHNLMQRAVIGGLHHRAAGLGVLAGGAMGAPGVGAVVGGMAGGAAAKALGGSISKMAVRARIRKL